MTTLTFPLSNQPPKLRNRVRAVLRRRHHSPRTEANYINWIERYLFFHHKRHPSQMGEAEIEAYLTDLAQECHLAGSTQNQALCALLFLYREVWGQTLSMPIKPARPSKTKRLPTVLSRSEVPQIVAHLGETAKLVIQLLYDSGLRLTEGVTLRVQDLDFAHRQLIVRNGQGSKERVTMLPQMVIDPLQEHLSRVKRLHDQDLAKGHGAVMRPSALARKYPQANREGVWQFVFSSAILSIDHQDGVIRRFHISPSTIQRALKQAANKAQIEKRVTSHAFRHSFVTHLLEQGYDIRTEQARLGHPDVRTTMIDTHVLNRGGLAVQSPLDHLRET